MKLFLVLIFIEIMLSLTNLFTVTTLMNASWLDMDIEKKLVSPEKFVEYFDKMTVSVLITGPYGICSGTLISNQHVLTAAHCMVPSGACTAIHEIDVGPENFTVYAHGICHELPGLPCGMFVQARNHAVVALNILEEYFEKCETGDLAILTLAHRIHGRHAVFKPSRQNPTSGQFTLSGWGYNPIFPESSGHRLQTVILTAVPCIVPRDDHICIEEIDKDACEGDSGAGLLDGLTIMGVVSSGSDCKTLKQLQAFRLKNKRYGGVTNGVFTSVNAHMQFICDVIQTADCKASELSRQDEMYTTLD